MSKTITHRAVALCPSAAAPACVWDSFCKPTFRMLLTLTGGYLSTLIPHGGPRTDFQWHPNAIMQTSDGYIWIGTQAGLVRFDGVRFVSQTPQSGFPSSPVISLLADPDGSLWIGTETGLIHWKNGAWITFPDVLGRVNSIQAKKRSIWVAQTRMPVGAKALAG